MKKLIFIIVSIVVVFTSCKTTTYIPPANPPKEIVEKFSELNATHNGIMNGNSEIQGPLLKEELEGALVSINGNFTITPEVQVESESEHKKGGIVRKFKITGDDPVEFENPHFLIENCFYSDYESPDSIQSSVVDGDSIKYCMTFYRTENGDYKPKIISYVETKQIYDDSVFVKEGNNYLKFRDSYGNVGYKVLPDDLPDSFFDNNGNIRDQYKIEYIPLYEINEYGDTIPVVEEIVRFDKDEAGYKYISWENGNVYYLSNTNIKLDKIYIKQKIDDRRELKRSQGYQSPNE